MSVVYRNPFGKKAYQPEVNGERRWRVSTYEGDYYVWAAEKGIRMDPDLRSKRSAARVERRRRRYLESVKRNTWEEVTTTNTASQAPVTKDQVDAAGVAMNRYYSQGGYISSRTAFLHGLRAAGIPTSEKEEVRDE